MPSRQTQVDRLKQAEASNTAKVIAASTILLASDARTSALIAPGAADLCRTLLSSNQRGRWLANSATHPLTRPLWRWVERLTLPGIMAHYWYRKRWIESRCRLAINEGAKRLVVIGAGFDTLGLRLAAEMSTLEVIEIDHPATQNAKTLALTQAPAHSAFTSPTNIRFVPCDLAVAPLPTWLYENDKSCVIVIEGVLMYLPPAEVARLLDSLRKLAGGRVRIIFTFMTTWPEGGSGFRPRSWLVERWLAWRKEPFTWSLAPNQMGGFLADLGYRLEQMLLTREFSGPPQGNNSTLDGENLVECVPLAHNRPNADERHDPLLREHL